MKRIRSHRSISLLMTAMLAVTLLAPATVPVGSLSAQIPAMDPTPTPIAPPPVGKQGVQDTTLPEEIASVPGVSEEWWQKVQAQILGDLYTINAEQAGDGPSIYRGTNPNNHLDFTFAAGGLRLANSVAGVESADGGLALEKEPAWTWELRATGYGYQGDVRSLPALIETASDGNRLEYRRDDLTEWYLNDERGLEQGFSLDAPPPGEGETVVLELTLDTGLVPILTGDLDEGSGQAIEFTHPDGNVVLLRYSDLNAYDAQGAPLPARMALSGCGSDARLGSCRLQLLVEAPGAPYPLTIDPLLTAPVWTALGENANDRFGFSVATAGDVNGDGYADLVVGAIPLYSSQGRAYVYHGSPAGLGAMPAWTKTGEAVGDLFGDSVAAAGDVNGDGYGDLLVGAPYYDSGGLIDRGKVYLYYGSPAGLALVAGASSEGQNADDRLGWVVASAGDVNGDGYADVVYSAPYVHNGVAADVGRVYGYYGSPTGPTGAWFTPFGENANDLFGFAVGAAGDVNDDGFDDLIVGAPERSPAGKVYVYYGSATGLDMTVDWTAVGEANGIYFGGSVATAGDVDGDGCDDVAVGAVLAGVQENGKAYVYHGSPSGMGANDRAPDWSVIAENNRDRFGSSIASAGDVNGDGYADLIVGAVGYLQGDHRGKVYVFHGGEAGLSWVADWTASGENVYGGFGRSATAGDVNGDGYDDVVVGACGYSSYRGKVYVYHGTAWGLTPAFDWTAGGEGRDDQFGFSAGTAGDLNGDGYADLVVGAWGYDEGRGKVYVFPGSADGLSWSSAWSATGQYAGDRFGRSAATAGDVNGDGYDDLVVGAPYNDQGGVSAGKAYVYYGSAIGLGVKDRPPNWTATGVHAYDTFGASVATAGSVNGDGYADLVVGADGYPQGSGNGKAYVYHGSPSGLSSAPFWTASGESAGDRFGYAVGTAGDVNGDSCDDLVAGAWGHVGYTGKVYVYQGCSPLSLGASPAWTATGEAPGDYFGWSVGAAGDVNGDGYADVAAGAWGYSGGTGKAYVYHGSAAGLGASNRPPNWFANGQSANDAFAFSLATAGDVNGDGYADLIVGAQGHDNARGAAYLHRGAPGGLAAADWNAFGAHSGDRFGAAVGAAGDVNGDGFSDLVAGAWGSDNPANTNAGRVYVYHSAAPGLSPTQAVVATGQNSDQLGQSVASSDVNGDGYADLIVGAPSADSGLGRVYVYYGSATGPGATADWTAVGATAGSSFGFSVAAGDVNGDGYADLAVGAWGYDGYRGKVYVYLSSAAGLGAEDRPPDWTAQGEYGDDYFGYSVATAGDVNGDGYADLVVGAAHYDANRGKAYVYLGSASGLDDTPAWSATGKASPDYFGLTVATAGDVNGDGYADVVVGAGGGPYAGVRGEVYVYHGGSTGLTTGSADWIATGENSGDHFGNAVATAGDVNGDGFADLVVGALGYDGGRGKVYVYHGSALGLDVPFSVLSGENVADQFGFSVASAGDVNGDGFADLVVGAFTYSIPDNPDTPESEFVEEAGRVYVYHGSTAGLGAGSDWTVTGESYHDWLGQSAAGAGDVNGDSYADLVVGANGFNSNAGQAYVYYGNDGGGRPALARQVRGDLSGQQIQPWGPSYTADSFGVWLQAVYPLGRGRARLQVQVCPAGIPFGNASCRDQISSNWTAVSGSDGVLLKEMISGLGESTLYRWRARLVYDSPTYIHGPWRRFTAQAQEADVRVTRLPADLSITKTMDPEEPLGIGAPITYTITYLSNGPARGVVISDVLSSDIASIQISSSGAVISDTGHQPCCVWTVEDLEAGEGGVITITGVAQADRFVNTAFISGTSPDPNPDNNQATVQTHVEGILYVDQAARGANNGKSWANAYTDLQDALAEAQAGDQIWIASGVYRPTPGSLRSASFQLVSGVAVHGGFARSERWLYERDPATPPTVLSGDIGTTYNPDDNVYHVVTATIGVTETAVLEGLTIAFGEADGSGANGLGGGLYSLGGSPTLVNVAFIGNSAYQGGGVYVQGGSPLLVDVAFSGNAAEAQGGGIYNTGGLLELTNVTFSGNAAGSGGGLYNAEGGTVTLTNAILWGNNGSQIVNDASTCNASYSDIQGGYAGTGNFAADPQFVDADGPDEIAGTLDDDLRIYTTFSHPSPAIDQGDTDALPADAWDLDGDLLYTETLPLDLSGRWRLIGFTSAVPRVDVGAYEATIQDVLAAGGTLFEQGEAFRLEHLQLLSADTLAQALQNYANFNDGEWYYAFCADYDQIDENGYCPPSGPGDDPTPRENVRNTLLDAVDLYRVALGYPASEFTPRRGDVIAVWEDGGQGVLSSMTEIANDHLIFGNEFLVDATDYRFSTGGIPNADQIITQELDQLEQAQRHFELIIDLVFRAFNEWDVGGYYTSDQYEQVGMASSLMMSTLNEIAARHYMLGDSEAALGVYDRAYTDQNLHLMAFAKLAEEAGGDYLRDGSWEMLNNLSQMRQRAQAIHDGLDFFGFAPEYVPLQAYEQLLILTQGPAGSTGLLGTARDLEDQAREAQRTFDANASAMATELDNLTVELDNQLFELCGNDFEACYGGLMLQNLDDLDVADRRAGLAWMRAQNLVEQVRVEQKRAEQVITVRLGLGQEIAAAELAIGALRKERTVDTYVTSSEDELHAGIELAVEAYLQQEYKWGLLPGWEIKGGFKESLTAKAGYNHAWTWIDSTEEITDWNEGKIGEWESNKALKQAIAEADIEGANSAAVVKNLLLQELEAVEEYKVAMAECNKLADEHNSLAERRSRLLNMREQAIDRVASHNSHLLNPAYRIWRDSLTTQSLRAHNLAAQFAYLTARAAEYELLTPYPDLGKIFRARTANDIRLFLDGLAVWVQALDLPGQLNRYPYTISLGRDLWGLTDEALIEEYGDMSAGELEALRYQEFQKLLQGSLDGNQLEVWFTTALEQQREGGQYLFSPNIWNNRIAGIGAPLARNQGVSMNIVTRQSGAVDGVEVVLVHGGLAGGAEAYRNALGETVYYDPDTAVPVGYKLPAALDPENTTVVLRPGVNGVGAIANSGLINLSVAASSWTLRIPANSRGNLDYSQIEDIQIVMDTTGRALPGLTAQAERDAQRLQAGLELEPVKVNPALEPTSSAPPAIQVQQSITAPSIAGQISGLYSGHVMITSPVTIAIQVLDIELWNTGGVLTGTIDAEEGALYPAGVELHGAVLGDTFNLTSDPFVTMVAGRSVTQTLTLVGHAEQEGDLLRADYTGTITNLLPEPILVQGKFMGSRPGASGSQRLVLDAGAWSLQPGASTPITATLYTEAMQIITATRTVTFTTDLGTLAPTVKQTVDGQAVVTFTAGATEGQATVIATTGEITSEVSIQISNLAAPIADFTATPLSGSTPLTVTFTDTSLRDPNGWAWDFGDGASSEEQNPTHVYDEIGTYTVDLVASNALGTDSLSRTSYIVVAEPMGPQAQFSPSTTSGVAPLTVTFTDQSTYSPTTWLWDFGDGSTSEEQNPTHIFTLPGVYTVTLTVGNDLGSDTLVMEDLITVTEFENRTIYLPLVLR